ncbi:recombinase family protein [Lichenihabitans sp. PAMC28606]|uniref:recombinase family protein n=1 Tax=Lichenihabitans sp. PAMC28606 TaxID=2880932 RepID=UPI001D0B6F39|nr:recombinase family protein [Lichenihabitans sp. PAMC28606]UDL96563.1 recombinase family protein [Lichenihabitans sp. PAMC28606]
MPRAALYARFSTDLQNEKSTEDQIELCRIYCARERLTPVVVFEDKARSGASIFGRDGLIDLMAQAKAKAFDVVVVEALDRLSRDMEDLAGIHKRLSFAGIELRAVHDGKADTVMVGLRGLVGQLFREDGAKKVRRGMAGVIRDGRHAGGRAYGYRPVPGSRGELAIVEHEASIVRRIFSDYVGGRTPREIAGALNHEGIDPPRGEKWNASTINGNAARGSGIIFNELYAGQIVWNKVRMIKDPDTGRRLSRANMEDDRARADAPQLRIVNDDVWTAAQAIKAERRHLSAPMARRPRHLLSGFLRCGTCGSGMSMHDRDTSGRIRIRCSTVRESGACTNTSRLRLERVETAVLDGLRTHMADPALIKAYVTTYNTERQARASEAVRNRSKIEARLAEAQRELDRAIQNLIKGRLSEDEADKVLPELRQERDAFKATLQACEDAPKLIALHPAAMAQYVATIDALGKTLADHAHATDDRGDLVAHFRALIQTVVIYVTPGSKEVRIELKGKLAAIIGGEPFPEKVGGSLVAEEGLEPPTRGL